MTATVNCDRVLLSSDPNDKKESKPMDLKLSGVEAVAVLTALQHYQKEVEKMPSDKGVEVEKKTLKGLISRMEAMPAGEVQ